MSPLTVPGRALVVVLLLLVATACAAPSRPASPSAAPAGAASQPAGASAGAAGSAPTAAPRPAKIRSAYVAIASNMLPSWIALDEGIYQKYALDVELSYIAGAAKISETL